MTVLGVCSTVKNFCFTIIGTQRNHVLHDSHLTKNQDDVSITVYNWPLEVYYAIDCHDDSISLDMQET